MSVTLQCQQCGARLKYTGQAMHAGQGRPCPRCGTTLTLTDSLAPPAESPAADFVVATVIESEATSPVSAPAAPAIKTPVGQRSTVMWIVLAVVGALGTGGLMLVLLCAGVGFMLHRSGDSSAPPSAGLPPAPSYDASATSYTPAPASYAPAPSNPADYSGWDRFRSSTPAASATPPASSANSAYGGYEAKDDYDPDWQLNLPESTREAIRETREREAEIRAFQSRD